MSRSKVNVVVLQEKVQLVFEVFVSDYPRILNSNVFPAVAVDIEKITAICPYYHFELFEQDWEEREDGTIIEIDCGKKRILAINSINDFKKAMKKAVKEYIKLNPEYK